MSAPRWERHACQACVYLGTYGQLDVYECFRAAEIPGRSFTIRSGPVPAGGFAAVVGTDIIVNPPEGIEPYLVADAVKFFMLGRKADA